MIDQQAHSERQSSERHRVETLAAEEEGGDCGKDRERKREQRNSHGAKAAKKQQYRQRREYGAENPFLH